MATVLRTTATVVLIAAALTQAACSGGGGASSPSTTDAGAPQTAAAPALSPTPAPTGSAQPASAGPTGSTSSAAPSSDTTAAASPTATVPPGSTMTLQPAPGLMVQVPADALTAAATTYDDSSATAVTVDVEYYSGGSKPAGDMLSAEQDALKSQGVEASADSATVEGGSNATRLSWTSSAVPPWSQDPHAAKVQVAATGVIVDGADGYSYGVYVFANSTRTDSTALMTAVLDSIVVTAP